MERIRTFAARFVEAASGQGIVFFTSHLWPGQTLFLVNGVHNIVALVPHRKGKTTWHRACLIAGIRVYYTRRELTGCSKCQKHVETRARLPLYNVITTQKKLEYGMGGLNGIRRSGRGCAKEGSWG